MYHKEWVQKLIRQIQQCLQTNSDWLGIDRNVSQRVLDYACGNGTVSSVSDQNIRKLSHHADRCRHF